jgi:3-dehydroquinate synthase
MSPLTLEIHRSEVLRQKLLVAYEYPVVFTSDAFDAANPALFDVITQKTASGPDGKDPPGSRHRVLAVVDDGLAAAWPETQSRLPGYFERYRGQLELVAPPVCVPGGESAKTNPALIDDLHSLFHKHRMDRHAYVLIVGGGGVLDAVGYAAATAHRGLRTVRMPTTVLAQNDSGVGVKNGVNAFGAKNFLGTFVPPFAVISDFRFLERLPRREGIAGLAEAVKVSLIRDADFFEWIETHAAALAALAPGPLAVLIRRCAELHMRHIATSGDPFEQGSARPLDFGHWAAHKLESLTAHSLRHGEAVALGVLLDSRYSLQVGLLPEGDFERIFALLSKLGLPLWHEALVSERPDGRLAVLDGLEEFREHLGGALTVTLLGGIGRGLEVQEMHESAILAAIGWMRDRARERPAS